jgi:hypothetical protein
MPSKPTQIITAQIPIMFEAAAPEVFNTLEADQDDKTDNLRRRFLDKSRKRRSQGAQPEPRYSITLLGSMYRSCFKHMEKCCVDDVNHGDATNACCVQISAEALLLVALLKYQRRVLCT